ncbi:hypothetical protein, partial [Erwinia amylovora]|uniref:hypothetical protein n=1 Tax=Erwinia amylovora TaxID=552 RepID=UPI001C5584CA
TNCAANHMKLPNHNGDVKYIQISGTEWIFPVISRDNAMIRIVGEKIWINLKIVNLKRDTRSSINIS